MIALMILPLLIIAGVLAYLATLPDSFEVRRSLDMNVDQALVFAQVRDLRAWRDWSPWLLHEPDARLAYSDQPDEEGGYYGWDGQAIGAGQITQVRLTEPTRIDQQLRFTRPFKSTSKVWWEFAPAPDGGTRVTWCMTGRLPLLLRFMTRNMARMIEQDFELGLALLRGTLDPQAERPQVRYQGITLHQAQDALTIPYRGDLAGLITTMEGGFPRLHAHLTGLGATPTGPLFTAYHKVDPKTMQVQCDLAIPVPDGLAPGPFTRKRLGGGRYFATELQGSYAFLGPVWASAITDLRMIRLRQDRSRPALEIYVTDASQVPDSNQLLTRILVAVR